MHIVHKGEYGYVSYKKRVETIKTIIFFIIPLSLFFAGWYATKTKVNLLTIVAVLGLLPASRSAVTTFMHLKSKGCSLTAYETIKPHLENVYFQFDLNITTYCKTFQVANFVMKGKTICAYSEDSAANAAELEKYIKESMEHNGYNGYSFKLFQDLEKYTERIDSMQSLEEIDASHTDAVIGFLTALSL